MKYSLIHTKKTFKVFTPHFSAMQNLLCCCNGNAPANEDQPCQECDQSDAGSDETFVESAEKNLHPPHLKKITVFTVFKQHPLAFSIKSVDQQRSTALTVKQLDITFSVICYRFQLSITLISLSEVLFHNILSLFLNLSHTRNN